MIVNGYNIVPWADLRGANLSEAYLSWANLRNANLTGADLRKANLRNANLSWANLSGANLSGADLSGADLSWANLIEADLSGANLIEVSLSWANLSGAILDKASLHGANLSGADLRGADLNRTNLIEANLSRANLLNSINLPDLSRLNILPEGDLIVYKKISSGIVKLLIPKEAKRTNGTTRKCRASYAIVLEGKDGVSRYDSSFIYKKGGIVRPREPFEASKWKECGSGIHFFITLKEAEDD